MNIEDNKRNQLGVSIDFGTIDEGEYDVLCATSFHYQGRSWKGNFTYEEISSEGEKLFKRERTGSVFEFPSNEWVDAWLAVLPQYFAPPKSQLKPRRKKSVTSVKKIAAI